MSAAAHDLTDKRFGRLVVAGRAESVGKRPAWHVRCDCGTEAVKTAAHLCSGATKSCGCLACQTAAANAAKRSAARRVGAWHERTA